MRTRVHGAEVRLAGGRTVQYGWATHIRVDHYWDLHVYLGRRQRVYHEAGEWLSYRAWSGHQPAVQPVTMAIHVPELELARDWAPLPRPGAS